MGKPAKYLAFTAVIVVALLGLFSLFQNPSRDPPNQVAYSQFLEQLDHGQVSEVTVKGRAITYSVLDKRIYATHGISDPGLIDRLLAKNVTVRAVPEDDEVPTAVRIFVNCLPTLLVLAVWIYFLRQIRDVLRQIRDAVQRKD